MTAIQPVSQNETSYRVEQLRAIRLFSSLKPQSLRRVEEECDWRVYDAGETIFSSNQYAGDEVLIFLQGVARAVAATTVYGDMRVQELSAGDIFGAAFALANEPAQPDISMVASAPCEIAAMRADLFADMLQRHASVVQILMRDFASALATGDTGLVASAPSRDAEARIYAELCRRAAPEMSSKGLWRISHMPKHRELADCAGASETAAAAAVAELIREGVARRDYPGLVIEDYKQLAAKARLT